MLMRVLRLLRERQLRVFLRDAMSSLRTVGGSTLSCKALMLGINNFNSQMAMRGLHKRNSLAQPQGVSLPPPIASNVVRDLQKTIDPHPHLPGRHKCTCILCKPGRFANSEIQDGNVFHSNSVESSRWFKRVVDGLTISGARTLKLFLPDILFVEGESLEVYQTSRKDGRVIKIAGLTPLKLIYPTFLRLRREYKSILEQSYNQQMLDKIDPQFMHLKYFDKLVPSHFDPGNDSHTLENNKHHFRRYILHKDNKYQIQQIEEHKMNEKEPFCLLKYKDGNCQLFNQAEFENYAITLPSKIAQEAAYFQSYIKYKQQTDSILYSQYTYSSTEINQQVDRQAEKEVMVLLGAINKYDDDYKDIETLEEFSIDLMVSDGKAYAQLMTYKIVHYLAMASRLYITHLKIKWILNDIGNIYLQEIMEMEVAELAPRIIRYRLPIKDDSLDFYNTNNFVDIYKDMRKRKAINTLIIKKDLDSKTYNEILYIMDPQTKQEEQTQQETATIQANHTLPLRERLPNLKRNKIPSQASRTIDVSRHSSISPNLNTISARPARFLDYSTYEEHLKKHPEIAMKNRPYNSTSLGRYSEAPGKILKVDKKINNHFIFNMSSQDYKTFNGYQNKQKEEKEDIIQFLQRKKEKVSQSVLFNTFHQLNCQRMKQINETLKKEQLVKSKTPSPY